MVEFVMNYIDRVFYINLERRVDRFQQINEQIISLHIPFEKVERFSAIEGGQIGCIQSHLAIIRLAKERQYKCIMILEDDFQSIVSGEEFHHELTTFFKKPVAQDFYVLMLSYLCNASKPLDDQLLIGTDCSDASAYIVHSCCYDRLIELLDAGWRNLLETGQHWLYMNDQVWKQLQRDDRWFIMKKRIGKQNTGFVSDLANTQIIRTGPSENDFIIQPC